MKNHFNPPTVDDVRRIANSFLSQGELSIQRLPTGLCHYVFDVQGEQQRFVIRICHPDNTSYLNGNLFWSTQLQKLSLPIPQIFKLSIEEQKYSFMILEYIDGVDLGELVDQMSRDQKAKVVDRLIDFQRNADTLPEAAGFGWGFHYNCPQLLLPGTRSSKIHWSEQRVGFKPLARSIQFTLRKFVSLRMGLKDISAPSSQELFSTI